MLAHSQRRMAAALSLLLALSACTLGHAADAPLAGRQTADLQEPTSRLIVRFKPSAGASERSVTDRFESLFATSGRVAIVDAPAGQQRVRSAVRLPRGDRSTFVVEADSPASAEAMLRAAKKDAEIDHIEPDARLAAFSLPSECGASADCSVPMPDFAGTGRFWGLQRVKAINLWETLAAQGAAFGSGTVKAGIIDTGVMASHDDLAGSVDAAASLTCVNGVCAPGGVDDNGHGTHVAGIAAAAHSNSEDSPLGVAQAGPGALVACKFLAADGSGWLSDALLCIDAMRAAGVAVMSNSWGGSMTSLLLEESIKATCQAGILFVVAAGNDGRDVADPAWSTYPAAYAQQPGFDCVLTVAAVDSADALASFSNYGKAVAVAAPGVAIYSSYIGSPSATTVMSGTSMATPLVAGAALGLRAAFPTLDAFQVKDALIASGSVVPSGRPLGGGIMEIGRAHV